MIPDDIDASFLQSLLTSHRSSFSLNDPSSFSASISESQRILSSLEAQERELSISYSSIQSEWRALKSRQSSLEAEIERLHSLSNRLNSDYSELIPWFMNSRELELFTQKCKLDAALEVASQCLSGASECVPLCKKFGFRHLGSMAEELARVKVSEVQTGLFGELENMLRRFSVISVGVLTEMFIMEPGKTADFCRIIDQMAECGVEWAGDFVRLASRVFTERFVYHCRHGDVGSALSGIMFVIGLLRSTLQAVMIIMSYPEKKGRFLDPIGSGLMETAISELLARDGRDSAFFRSAFEQSCLLDEWIESLALFSLGSFASRLFEAAGEEWIAVEVDSAAEACRSLLEREDDFTLPICGLISGLGNSVPATLTTQQKQLFFESCVLRIERTIVEEVEQVGNTGARFCAAMNCLLLVSAKLIEIYELQDVEFPMLLSEARTLRDRAETRCKEAGKRLYRLFEQTGGNYLLGKRLPWRNGNVSPELEAGLTAISGEVAVARATLEPSLFTNCFLPDIATKIDSQVYRMLIRPMEWKSLNTIEQFKMDLAAMADVFGRDDLRLLRSALVCVSQKEEPGFVPDLPEEDCEHFITMSPLTRE
jgi:hypothetical protein